MDKKAELLDVLDENGVRTGEVRTREECHKLGLWHRIALLVIVNDENKILMQRRSPTVSKFPGLWDLSVASHVQAGDDSLSTVLRETNEEIGVQIGFRVEVRDFRLVTSFRNRHTWEGVVENQYYDLFMLRKNIDACDITFNDNEVSEIKFVDYTELQKLLKASQLHPRTEWVEEVMKVINRF